MRPIFLATPLLLGLLSAIYGGCSVGDATDSDTSLGEPGSSKIDTLSTPALTSCPSGETYLQIAVGLHGTLDDTSIDPNAPTTNYGSNTQLYSSSFQVGGGTKALLKFTPTAGLIPYGANITHAVISMFNPFSGNGHIAVYTVNTSWSEATTTYATFPAGGANTPAFRTAPFSSDGVQFDVSQVMNDWNSGALTNNGIEILALGAPIGSSDTDFFTMTSSEGSLRPTLDICYKPSPCAGVADGTSCGDPGRCVVGGICVSGKCLFGGPAAAGVVCRAADASNACDVGEVCNGTSTECPTDQIKAAGTVCRASAGPCDVAETCDGAVKKCPYDAFKPFTTVCRAAVGDCDAPETCTSGSAACPSDIKQPINTACTSDGNLCTKDVCDGVGDTCVHPVESAGVVCRAAGPGGCDAAETCTGSSTVCPPDILTPSGVACPDDGNPCTQNVCDGLVAACQHPAGNAGATCATDNNPCTTDVCDGTSTVCSHPAGNAGAACATDNNPCTTDLCNGSSTACQYVPGNAGAVCRAVQGECDVADTCTGSSATCPADVKKPINTACGDDANPCTTDKCDGVANACQHPAGNVGASCADDANPCTTDTCNGASTTCQHPAGNAGASCASDANPCTTDTCNGSSTTCQHPAGNAGTLCRAAAGVCDVAESCNGSSTTCPADAKVAVNTVCADDGNVCSRDICDGSAITCTHPAGNAGTVCRSSAGTCDVAETCTGASTSCPANGFASNGTACGGGSVCSGGTCLACGGGLQNCCAGSCNFPTLNCDFSSTTVTGTICAPCGSLGADCCHQGVPCTGTVFTCQANGKCG
jgi:slime mold repeat-containing protein